MTDFEGELISDEESREGTLEWVPYDKVLSKPTWEGDYEIFKWILDDVPFFSAKFTFNNFSIQIIKFIIIQSHFNFMISFHIRPSFLVGAANL